MEKWLMVKQIAATIQTQEQLVFLYKRSGDDEIAVRFVTPIEMNKESVLCAQHLPEEGYRRFKFEGIQKFHRVISREALVNSDFFAKSQKPSLKGDNVK